MKKQIVLGILLGCMTWTASAAPLDEGFVEVPTQARPWAYWWWLNGNVDKETITRDMEALRRVGFGGILMFDSRGYHNDIDHVILPAPKMEFMSKQWREMLAFGIKEAARVGLQVSVNLSSCAGALKGPWRVGGDAPKRLIWQAIPLTSETLYEAELKGPADREYFWDIATMAVKYDGAVIEPMDQWLNAGDGPIDGWSGKKLGRSSGNRTRQALEVIDLTGKIDQQGRLAWKVPKGRWTLLRFGSTTIDGHEYDVDMMDPKAVEAHFNRMGKAIIADVGSLAGKTLTHFYSVSWEGSVPTWTGSFEANFREYRGYDIRPWLPVLAAFVVESPETSQRFMSDYRRARNDVFRDKFYGTMVDLCHRHGLKWHSESGGPWKRDPAIFGEADQLAFLARNDMPQGEYWWNGVGRGGRQMSRPQAMTAHVYGKRLAAAEAFTHMRRHWTTYPATLKRCGDQSFVDGVNQLVWHTFTCSPKELGLPGSEYFAGTHVNPNVTWFEQVRPFVSYLGRCQYLLRQGLFVADVCVFTGDVPYQHWGRFTTKWSDEATMELPAGHGYDIINTEALSSRVTVRNGDLVLPDGMSYRLLVVDPDEDKVSLAALRRIEELKAAGALVVFGKRKPTQHPGAAAQAAKLDAQVKQLGKALWAGTPTLKQAFKEKGLVPDFEGPFEYTHRRDAGTDIYFVAGTGKGECTFRVQGKQPELWCPVTGKISEAVGWRSMPDGRTTLTLDLPQDGSVFVVFRKPGQPRAAVTPAPSTGQLTLDGRWDVSFMPGRGAPATAVFDSLIGWHKHSDARIRHFSGTATYRKTFAVSKTDSVKPAWLELGSVGALAQVRLNGKDLGVVWTAPWKVELTGLMKSGKNALEIEVTNTWANRLIGDAALPPEQRITKSNLQYEKGKRTLRNFQGFASSDELQPSGLMGPVMLKFY